MDPLTAAVAERLAVVRDRIGPTVRIVAVTKGWGAEAVEAARHVGLVDVGENYAQELVAKARTSPEGTRWHMLGHVQRNKVKALAPVVDVWQSVDRSDLLRAVAAHRPGAKVFVQVDTTGAPGRNGCDWDDVESLVEQAVAVGLDVRGLMAVGPRIDPAPAYRRLVALADELGLPERSMGMSDDLEIAVAEGATTVRVGRALFGPRPDPRDLRR